ncbi:MAG: PD-(D/E)XK nuclease family protein [Anaerolineae bacterium]
MTTSLFLAPAAAGKTRYAVRLALDAAHDLSAPPRIVLANRVQIRSWRRLLAESGGAMGIRLLTFADLYLEILQAAGEHPVRLPDAVQVRIVRALLDESPQGYFGPLRQAPALAIMLRDLFSELQAEGIEPPDLTAAVQAGPPRLEDVAQLYGAYVARLDGEDWADHASLGRRALVALQGDTGVACEWPLLVVDGLDEFSGVQGRVLAALGARTGRLVITLTGEVHGLQQEAAHRRANVARDLLERRLGVTGEFLPEPIEPARAPVLAHLGRTLHTGDRERWSAGDAIAMVAAPDREAEIRVALRWLKQQMVSLGISPDQVALLARDLEPYRVAVQQVASEYGIPLALSGGLPLRDNPAVAALVSLLMLSAPGDATAGAYAWRPTVEAWRSPYFDLSALGIAPGDADRLEIVARWGNVVGGQDQWRETLNALASMDPGVREGDDDRARLPESLPTGDAAAALLQSFERFVERLTLPGATDAEGARCLDYVSWLEELVGETTGLLVGADLAEEPDADPAAGGAPNLRRPTDIGLARRAAAMPAFDDVSAAAQAQHALATRDVAALNALKDVLRGLVWAEEALKSAPQSPSAFLDDLLGAINAAGYLPPLPEGQSGIFAGTVAQARGLPFEIAAVVGLAEGEFPAALREDMLLRDSERISLNRVLGSHLRLRTESTEAELFYTAATRPRRALLLTRPRIADNGAPWQPSPFWEEVLRHVDAQPDQLTTSDRPQPVECASWPELWQAVGPVLSGGTSAAAAWAQQQSPSDSQALLAGAQTLIARLRKHTADSPFDGGLTIWAANWRHDMGPKHRWSVSQLEAYRRCPYSYFVADLLHLEPRQSPAEGLDPAQVGTIYHRILAELYRTVGPGAQLQDLLERLDEVALPILEDAPRRDGFRPTAWWTRTREAMRRILANTLVALQEDSGPFGFLYVERAFGRFEQASQPLEVHSPDGDSFQLRGFIDRVDVDGEGRLRVIDYKSGGVRNHNKQALEDGDDLQLALYALGVEKALALGVVADGFYWGVVGAEASPLTLASFEAQGKKGPAAAVDVAVERAWEAIYRARAGVFVPTPPPGGCPAFCPALSHCWHYREVRW